MLRGSLIDTPVMIQTMDKRIGFSKPPFARVQFASKHRWLVFPKFAGALGWLSFESDRVVFGVGIGR
jgi:hypothetical protein